MLQAIRDEHAVIPKIERWRELTKLAQTYLDALPLLIAPDGRLHTTFNQTAATTGRLSSNNPNLQNIPIRTELGREIRACFVAEPGNLLVSADYSQVELRLLAHIAGEDVLKEIFRRGEDVHTATACRVFGVTPEQIDPGMRSKAKMINYGIVYGLSAYGMADRLDIPQEEADEFIQRYLAGFPAVGRFIEETIAQGTEHGYVSTLFGRRRQVPELRARRWELRKQGERFAVNMVIQGTAADIMKVAMVRCDRALTEAGLRSRLVLQIHDELLFEGPAEEAEQVKQIACKEMGAAFEMDPPLAVEAGIGRDWLAASDHEDQVDRGRLRCRAGGPLPAAQAKPIASVIPDIPTARSPAAPRSPGPGRQPSLWRRTGAALKPHARDLLAAVGIGGLTFDPGYESLIEQFLANVAADSHQPTNVYSLTGQYRDGFGPAAYESAYGGAVVATDQLPASSCVEPPITGPGWGVCLSDSQLQAEIEHVIRTDRLPTGPDDLYFLVTPKGPRQLRCYEPTGLRAGWRRERLLRVSLRDPGRARVVLRDSV